MARVLRLTRQGAAVVAPLCARRGGRIDAMGNAGDQGVGWPCGQSAANRSRPHFHVNPVSTRFSPCNSAFSRGTYTPAPAPSCPIPGCPWAFEQAAAFDGVWLKSLKQRRIYLDSGEPGSEKTPGRASVQERAIRQSHGSPPKKAFGAADSALTTAELAQALNLSKRALRRNRRNAEAFLRPRARAGRVHLRNTFPAILAGKYPGSVCSTGKFRAKPSSLVRNEAKHQVGSLKLASPIRVSRPGPRRSAPARDRECPTQKG